MLAIYHVVELGRQSSFLNSHDKGADAPRLLSAASAIAAHNGGCMTEALAEVTNEGMFYANFSALAHPLQRLDAAEAAEYNSAFDENSVAAQRVTIDLDSGGLRFEYNGAAPGFGPDRNRVEMVSPPIMGALTQARQAPAIRLKDLVLLGLPPNGSYLVHQSRDMGFVPAGSLPELTAKGREDFADLLNAKVTGIRSGAYGVELELCGVNPERLADYDRAQAAMRQGGPFQPDAGAAPPDGALEAVTDYLRFEQETAEIWPWFLSAEEMLGDDRTLREVAASLHPDPEHGYDTEEVHQALTGAFGINPMLEPDWEQTMV